MTRLTRLKTLFSLFLALSCAGAFTAHAKPPATKDIPPGATPKEIEMGDKAAAEIAKEPRLKLLTADKDPKAKALLEKLNKMAEELGKVSTRPQIKYSVKVIDDKDLNAFTLPNGQIYFYTGLIDFAGSDDEIAAVMAHEIGHNTMMHALRGDAKARKLSWTSLAVLLAMLGGGQAGADVAQFSQYLLTAIMNGYGVEYEKEADNVAVDMLAKTSYNPSALVLFMKRLELEEKRRPSMELGIFQTHPPSEERATAALEAMKDAGLTFNPRDVQGGAQFEVVEDKDRVAIKFDKATLLELALDPQAKPGAKERATQAASKLNTLMRAGLKMHEVRTDSSGSSPRLLARGQEIAVATAEDAKLSNTTPLASVKKWQENLKRLFWKETISGSLTTKTPETPTPKATTGFAPPT